MLDKSFDIPCVPNGGTAAVRNGAKRTEFIWELTAMKLGIIGGAGLLGSTGAYMVALRDVIDEIKLLDLNKNLRKCHKMDLEEAAATCSRTKITEAEYEDLSDCDIILITAAVPARHIEDRHEYIADNLRVLTPICAQLKSNCRREPVVICCANPADVFTYVTWKLLGCCPDRVIGFNLNDTVRFRIAVAAIKGVRYADLTGYTIGEHGDGQVRLYEQLTCRGEHLLFSKEEKIKIAAHTRDRFHLYESMNCNRTTGWISGLNLAEMITAIATDSGRLLPCSAVLTGEFGYDAVAVGVLCTMGKDGIRQRTMPALTEEQQRLRDEAVAKIKGQISLTGL